MENRETEPHTIESRNMCWSEAAAALLEIKLKKSLNEIIIIDSQDFWEKQITYGMALDDETYNMEKALRIAKQHGIKYFKRNTVTGTYLLDGDAIERLLKYDNVIYDN